MDPFPLQLWPYYRENNPVDNETAFIDDVTIDSRIIKGKQALFVALKGRRGDGHMYVEEALANGAAYALVDKKWRAPSSIVNSSALIRCDNTLETLQDLAKVLRKIHAPTNPVILIAGCTGKTMLKDLLSHTLKDVQKIYISPESYNSQIGVALSLINMPKNRTLSFIEAAANQEGEMEKIISMVLPTHVIVTNYYRQRYGIDSVKASLLEQLINIPNLMPDLEWALVEKESTSCISKSSSKSKIYFWNDPEASFPKIIKTAYTNSETHFTIETASKKNVQLTIDSLFPFMLEQLQITLITHHLLKDILNIDIETVINSLQKYRPQTIRTELWKNTVGTTFINGTYSHEALSFAASLEEMASLLATISCQSGKPDVKRALIFGGLKSSLFDERQKRRIIEAIAHLHISDIYFWPLSSKEFLDISLADEKGITVHPSHSLLDAIHKSLKPRNHYTTKINHAHFDTVIFKGAEKLSLATLFQEIEDSPPHTYVSINLAAIRHNIDQMKLLFKKSMRIMIMVKALAYGTDDSRIAHFLRKCGIDILGVSYVDEAVALRKRGVEQHLFVLNVMTHEMIKAAKWNLEVGIGSYEQIIAAIEAVQIIQKDNPSFKMKIHLHLDTGMKRFGCNPSEAIYLASEIIKHPSFLEFEGLFTHFCSADDPDQDPQSLQQIEVITKILQELESMKAPPSHVHIANSAASIRFSDDVSSMARIGLATYGIYTSPILKEVMPTLRPALSLVTKIAGLHHAVQGDTVSYGRRHVIEKESALIAVLPIGYYDGIHRIYSGKIEVLIRGILAPSVGTISMDYMMVDVSHIPGVSVGDAVLIFGEDEMGNTISIEEFAKKGGSIPHELMTCLGPRIQRVFLYDESLRTR